MTKRVGLILFLAFIFFIIGDSANDAFEIQSNGATMCMACIGLE